VAISVAVQRLLCAKYGNVCAYPGCTTNLIVSDGNGDKFFGELAHIVSGRPGGPRYDPNFPASQINSEPNLLVMCERHHHEIDSFVDEWPTEKLQKIRREVLSQRAVGWKPWLPRLQAINYANPIRLGHLALLQGVPTNFPNGGPDRTPGLGTFRWVQAVLDNVSKLEIEARRLTVDFNLRTLRPGELLVFDRQVRTLHGVKMDAVDRPLTGDLDVDPLIYFSRGGIRLVMPLDPQWITTQTALLDFVQGTVNLTGLCQIKRRVPPSHPPNTKRKPRGQFIASPLLLGIGECPPDADLVERKVFQALDLETGEEIWDGPWL
jgi:hypothetical protein